MANLYRRKGAEILVNTETLNAQQSGNIALLPGGGFVIVWNDGSMIGGDTSGSGIKGQRFDADGNKVGAEFLVNTIVTANQGSPVVTTLPSGRFVVTWTDASATGGDTSGTAVRSQIFEANGTPVGAEFLVNTATLNGQGSATVGELAGGGFVVSWTDASDTALDDGTRGTDIKSQLFDAAGAKVGGEILVNTSTFGGQGSSTPIGLPGGGFAVAWQGVTISSGGVTTSSVRLQLFDAAGAKVGTEQVVNTSNQGIFVAPTIAALGSGFIVTWPQQDAPPVVGMPITFDIRAQLFDASGAKVGAEFVVNTTTEGTQSGPDVDAVPGGGFLVTWHGQVPGTTDYNIYGQFFDASGAKLGAEFVVNSETSGNQTTGRVDVLASGDIVVIWTDNSALGGDTSFSGIKMQILTQSSDAPTDIALSGTVIDETAIENIAVASLSATGSGLNSAFTYEIVSDSSGGAFRIEGDRLVVDDNGRLDFETQPNIDLRIRVTDINGASYEETIALTIEDVTVETRYSAGDEFLVPAANAGLQGESTVTALAGGRMLVMWKGGAWGLHGRILEADGQPTGGDLALSDFAFGSSQKAVALPGGGFALFWNASAVSGGNITLAGQIFDAAGAPLGARFEVNANAVLQHYDAALLDAGRMIVTFGSDVEDNPGEFVTSDQIRAQILDLAGNKLGADFPVNTTVVGEQLVPQVATLPGGGFVVGWSDGGDVDALRAQFLNSAGAKVGGEIEITPANSGTSNVQLAAIASGGFVATWTELIDEGGPTEHIGVFGQLVGADGAKIGGPFLIDAALSNYSVEVRVVAVPDDGFVIVWNGVSLSGDGDGDAIMAQRYDGAGARIGEPFVINQITREDQVSLSVTVSETGDLLFTWSDIFHPPNDVDANIKARIITFLGNGPIDGTPGPDTLLGTADPDELNGLGGNDVINGLGGADLMRGGTGNDTYVVDSQGDAIVELAGEGDDTILASVSYILGAAASVETMSTTNQAGTAPIALWGNDIANSIYGNEGDNQLLGFGGMDQLIGYGGNDVLVGGFGIDVMRGELGNDQYGIDEGDLIFEAVGEGDDTLAADIGSYYLTDGASIESLTTANQAGTFAQNMTGNEFGQSVSGSEGANVLNGAGGIDLLRGYGGADIFLFDTAPNSSTNYDVIADMAVGVDKIALQNAVFTGLTEGNLGVGQFVIGTAAQDADDRIIWNQATSQLFFDADGNGAGAAVLFAIVNGSPSLSAADFMII